jgi:pilus assembly protein CpaB
MNWKTWLPLTVAIVLGLLAMKIARDVLNKNKAPLPNDNSTQVVVLNKDLPAGMQISAADLGTRKMSGDVDVSGLFTNPADLEGRVLTSPAVKNTPIMQTMLAPKGAQSGLSAVIPDGMRAITIEINEFTGVAGYLQPGCRVDLVSTITDQGEMLTRTVVQNLKVQAVGVRHAPEGEQPPPGTLRSVTLLASPKEAEAIDLAVTAGRTRLVLRSNDDNQKADSQGVTVAELRGKPAENTGTDPFESTQQAIAPSSDPLSSPTTQPVASRKPAQRQRIVQFIRGTHEESIAIDDPAESVATPMPAPAQAPAAQPDETQPTQTSSAADTDDQTAAADDQVAAQEQANADDQTGADDQIAPDDQTASTADTNLSAADTDEVAPDDATGAEDGVTQADVQDVAPDLNK